jgi:hypothetical protein
MVIVCEIYRGKYTPVHGHTIFLIECAPITIIISKNGLIFCECQYPQYLAGNKHCWLWRQSWAGGQLYIMMYLFFVNLKHYHIEKCVYICVCKHSEICTISFEDVIFTWWNRLMSVLVRWGEVSWRNHKNAFLVPLFKRKARYATNWSALRNNGTITLI